MWLCTTVALYTGGHIQQSVVHGYSFQVGADWHRPAPFTLKCLSPWGHVPADPDICPRTDIISDVLVNVRVLAAADRLVETNRFSSSDAESGRLCDRSLMIMWRHIILESIDLWQPTERYRLVTTHRKIGLVILASMFIVSVLRIYCALASGGRTPVTG